MKPKPVHATVTDVGVEHLFVRTTNGQLWALPPESIHGLKHGDTVLVRIDNPNDQFCVFLAKIED